MSTATATAPENSIRVSVTRDINGASVTFNAAANDQAAALSLASFLTGAIAASVGATVNAALAKGADKPAAADKKATETKKPDAVTASGPSGATQPSEVQKGDAPEGSTATYDDVKKVIVALSQANRDHAIAVLARHGVKRATELKEDQFASVVQLAQDALDGKLNPEESLA